MSIRVVCVIVAAAVVLSAGLAEEPPQPAPTPTPAPQEDLLEDEELGDDDSLLGDDDLLGGDALGDEDSLFLDAEDLEAETSVEAAQEKVVSQAAAEHQQLFLEDRFPSAATCATCHPKQYREWSVSQHAYAQLSPLMMAMQNKMNLQMSTTIGDFCLRCHAPIGSELGEPFSASNLDRHPASREGITCITCHRMPQEYGKVTGRIAFESGDIYAPVYGPSGNDELERVLSEPEMYRVVTSPDQPGRAIHREVRTLETIDSPKFCATCHEVLNFNGFRVEETYSEYRHSPAAERGDTCVDCHMGKVEGKPSGFDHGPAAVVGGVPTRDRKLTNHYFAGPDAPIVHPGIFPHNVRASELKTMREWLEFDVDAGWGTDAFEDSVDADFEFPDAWRSIDDRYDAREIINEQQELLAWARERRLEVMRNGFGLGPIEVERDGDGLEISIEVASATDGHLVPTGFDAERLIYMEVVVHDAAGIAVYKSGDRDPAGDLRDDKSAYVKKGLLPVDEDLFHLKSKFVTRLVRGGEQVSILPVNTSVSALPMLRPEDRPSTLYGRAKGVRKHRGGIEPGGSREPEYHIDPEALTGREPYTVTARLRYQAVPIHFVRGVQSVGFDFGMTSREVADKLIENCEVIWERRARITTVNGAPRAEQFPAEYPPASTLRAADVPDLPGRSGAPFARGEGVAR